MTDSKTLDQWLVINWKQGSTRTRKSEPPDLGTYEIATRLVVDIEIPEVDVPELAATVQVPQPFVQTAVLENVDEEDLPDWSDTAEQVLHEAVGDQDLAEDADVRPLAERLTTRVLVDFGGYAEADEVRDYLWGRLRDERDREDGGDA